MVEVEMRLQKDEIDLWCEQWANQRRKILGILELEPRDRIGKLKSTLGTIREERDGASQGTVMQNFPEVYTGFSLLVNRAWLEMTREWRPIVQAHYCCLFWDDARGEPVRIKVKEKAALLDIDLPCYWNYLKFAKNYVHSFVTVSTKYSLDESVGRVYTQYSLQNTG
jgi:hypothetical protein